MSEQSVCQVNNYEHPTVIRGIIKGVEAINVEKFSHLLVKQIQHTNRFETIELNMELAQSTYFIGRYACGSCSLSEQSLAIFVNALCLKI